MKQVVNFRLSMLAIDTLSNLKKKLHISKTTILEEALQAYAKKNMPAKNTLLKYAGTLNEEEASSMLSAIKLNKYNKKLKTKL